MIDAYAHIGLPRFQTVEACLANLDRNGIEAAMVCPFETGPDLAEVHRARLVSPKRFKSFGLALGDSRELIEAGLHAQFDAGFDGFRLPQDRILDVPSILDVVGEREGIPMVVGSDALAPVAATLIAFLDRYPRSIVLGQHMAGPTSPRVFAADPAVKALFGHPNFYAVLTRQPRFPDAFVDDWVNALIEIVGWDRLMWGSETPVLFWRDESIAFAAEWFTRFGASPADLEKFRGGTARRAVFGRPERPVAALKLPYDPFAFEMKRTAPMFPFGLPADTRIPAKLVAKWMAAGGPDVEPLSTFTSRLLLAAVERD
jgi:hypothetical protein